MLRAAGIVALLVLATACGQPTAKSTPTPSPVAVQGTWVQNLTLTGDVSGQMRGIVPDSGDLQSQCTGGRTRVGETWADSFYGTVDASGNVWGVVFVIKNFRGPGTYTNGSVTVELHSTDQTQVWGVPGDKITFVLDRGQQSGSIDAKMTNAVTGKATQQMTGRWNCQG
jgi:hypothetical protein